MIQTMDKKLFDVLATFALHPEGVSQRKLALLTGHALGSVNALVRQCSEMGYVVDGKITKDGVDLLEPYRAKRAIFLAAGFSARLAPITFNTPKPLVRVGGKRIIDGLLDAVLAIGIEEIHVVRGYLGEQFNQLLEKYPMIHFLENSLFNESNNITSALAAKDLLENAYVFESDLILQSPLLTPYHYQSDFLAISKKRSDDWCFQIDRHGIIQSERLGGFDAWQMVGISYWDAKDGASLAKDLPYAYSLPGGKEMFWEQVPLSVCHDHYKVAVRPCLEEQITEIDTYRELKAIDHSYEIPTMQGGFFHG